MFDRFCKFSFLFAIFFIEISIAIVAFYDFCSGSWQVTGSGSRIQIYDLTIIQAGIQLNSSIDPSSKANTWDVYVSGQVQFQEIAQAQLQVYYGKSQGGTTTIVLIGFSINDIQGVSLSAQMTYTRQNDVTYIDGSGAISLNVAGNSIAVQIKITYCSDPLKQGTIAANFGYRWYIETSASAAFSLYGKTFDGGAIVIFYKKATRIDAQYVQIGDWEGSASGNIGLSGILDGVDGTARATVVLKGSSVVSFAAGIQLNFYGNVDLAANVYITPSCPTGGTWTGDGVLKIMNIPNVPTLVGTASLEWNCNKDGGFKISIAVSTPGVGFTLEGKTFSIGNVIVVASRGSSSKPVHVAIQGIMSNIYNLQAAIEFDLPFNNIFLLK